jgi:hypothetical protein
MRNNLTPRVSLGGHPVHVMTANDREIVIAPTSDQFSGSLSIETEPGQITELAIDLPSPSRERKIESNGQNGDYDSGGAS